MILELSGTALIETVSTVSKKVDNATFILTTLQSVVRLLFHGGNGGVIGGNTKS